MGSQVRAFAIGSLLGLSAALGFIGCSGTNSPDTPKEATNADSKNWEADLPSGAELEQSAGEAAEAVADGVSAAWEKASSAMKNFEGSQEMLGSMKEIYGSVKSSLSDITSDESAENARKELNKLSQKVDDWKPTLSEMSEDTKVSIKPFFEHVADQLSAMGEQLQDNEWVNEILRPKLRELVEQLKSLI